MALTYTPETNSKMQCPDFEALGTDGRTYTLSDFSNQKVLCFLFICNHCPYVQAIEQRIIELNRELSHQSVAFIGVCSNDAANYPEDSYENIQKRWKAKNYNFTYLYDESQKIAKDFGAVCTPDIFVFDSNRTLFYRGRFDDSWKAPERVKHQDLKIAITDSLNGRDLSFKPVPSMGCSIKFFTI